MTKSNHPYLAAETKLQVRQIDDDHNELFDRLETLKRHCYDDNVVSQSETDALVECLRTHCANEQRLAEIAGIDFSEHAQIHEKMLKIVTLSVRQIHEGQGDVFSLIKYIQLWFERHIHETDASFANELKIRGVTKI